MADTAAGIPRMADIALELEDLVEEFYIVLENGEGEKILRAKHDELADKLLWVHGHGIATMEATDKLLAGFLYEQYTEALGRQAVNLLAYIRAPKIFGEIK